MAVRIQKSAVNIREKLAELERPIGVNGQALMATNTPQDAFSLIGARNRNRIINGDCRIDQRRGGSSGAATDGGYYLDRWQTIINAGAFSVQQNAGSITPPAGFNYYIGATVTSAAGTTPPAGTSGIRYKVEGYNISDLAWGTSSAKTVTLSFWAYSSLTGSFGGSIWNSAQSYSYPFLYNVPTANTWTYITITIPGSTEGVWNTTNGTGIGIDFSMGTTTNTLGTAGSWTSGYKQGATGQVQHLNTNGSTLYLTGVQLEEGKVATPFEFRSYGQELALCQRYYKKGLAVNGNSNSTFFWSYYGGSLGVNVIDIDMPTFKGSPNISLLNNSNVQYYSYAGAWTNTTLTATTIGSAWPNISLYLYISADGDGRGKLVRCTNATDVHWVADAEL